MDDSTLPAPIQEALVTTTSGATGVARLVIAGLLELGDDHDEVRDTAALLARRLPGYAPLWHIANAVRGDDPIGALRQVNDDIDDAVAKTVATAESWVRTHGGPVTCAPSSSVVNRVLARLGSEFTDGAAVIGLTGADAIGVTQVLNIIGTRDLVAKLPVLVVTTSHKLVPDAVFDRLGTPAFERIPLSSFVGVVLDGEVVSPAEAGRRAAAIAE